MERRLHKYGIRLDCTPARSEELEIVQTHAVISPVLTVQMTIRLIIVSVL